MAGPAPKTRDWSARENKHKPRGFHIVVHGQVEVTNTNIDPVLTESAERNPKNLGLTLTLKQHAEPGVTALVWKNAVFHRKVKDNEFDHVNVRWEHDRIAEFAVIDDGEHHGAHTSAMAAVNAKHGKAPKKAAAKKAAPKKAAAKKAPAKKAKKAAKKAPKKKAKKAAKKSTLKRLVRGLVKKLTPKKAKKKKGSR